MLSVILGCAELARRGVEESEPIYTELEAIEKAARRAADLTRQLLAFGRKQMVVPEVLSVNARCDFGEGQDHDTD